MSHSEHDRYVVSHRNLQPDTHEHGSRTFRQYRLAHATVGEDLGASLYELDPGHRTWPAHYHTGNEEAVYVLDGRVTLHLGSGDERVDLTLESGDYVALPAGPEHVHELSACGDRRTRFLVVSTMNEPDFTVLTEEEKVHLVAGDPPGEYEHRYVSRTLDADPRVPYWDDSGTDGESEPDTDGPAGEGTAAGRRDSTDPPVVSAAELEWTDHDYSDRGREGHRFRRTQLGAAAGSRALGASLYEVPSGKRTWLPHYHTGNAEAVYVLDGEGTVWLGPDRAERVVSSGDYVALPRGEAGYHDVVAGDEWLRYLMVSTMNEPDVTVYPDDGKVGLFAGSAPGGESNERTLSTYLDADAGVEYWSE